MKFPLYSLKSNLPAGHNKNFSGYFIQFCIIACFLWLTVMWIDICIHAWYYLPRGIKQTPKDDNLHLMYYSLFAFGLSLILVILTYKNKLSGLPSYYIKGSTKGAYKSIDIESHSELIFLFCMFIPKFVISLTSFHPPPFLPFVERNWVLKIINRFIIVGWHQKPMKIAFYINLCLALLNLRFQWHYVYVSLFLGSCDSGLEKRYDKNRTSVL